MLVTTPCVLLLLDYWPLGRLTADGGKAWQTRAGRLVLEKLPLFALSAAAVLWTIVLQGRGGATRFHDMLTPGQRLSNAVVSVVRYLDKTVRPVDLSAFYPYRTDWPAWQVAAAAALVLAASALAVAFARSRPYLFVGWFWFLGMLVPVSGIVQAGLQAMADRYTYLPSIGLLLAVVWGVAELCRRAPPLQRLAAPVGATLLVVLAFCTWLQQSYWSSTLDLFEHALVVEDDNWMGHLMVGTVKSAGGDEAGAIEHYSRAIEKNPAHPNAWNNRGSSYMRLGNPAKAVEDLRRAIAIQPGLAQPRFNLGVALIELKAYEEAAASLAEAARLEPGNSYAHYWWGQALLHLGRRREAVERFAAALALDPEHPYARPAFDRATAPETAPATAPSTAPATAPAQF
jgi:tetratricopeptide (TPR) repeat protein